MKARPRLRRLIDVLQAWHARLPESADVFLDLFTSNELGSYRDVDLLKQASEELSETFQTLRDVVKVIETASFELTSSYRRAANHILPPMKLPFEVLGSIFETACQPSQWNEHVEVYPNAAVILAKCRQTRLAIGSSCSHFRQVLLNTPTAWSHISVSMDYGEPTTPSHALVPLEVARGKASPVHLYVFDERAIYSQAMWYWKSVKDSLYSLQGRLQTLLITSDGSCRTVPPLIFLSGDFLLPALKTIHVAIRQNPLPAYVDIRGAPALETLDIEYARVTVNIPPPLSIMCHPTSSIRELRIHGGINVDDTLNLLASCHQSLEAFRWTVPIGTPFNLPIPRTPHLLPNLRKLYLDVPSPLSLLHPSRNIMPNLAELALDKWTQSVEHDVDPGVISLPSLDFMSIGSEGFLNAVLEPFFRANPTIQEIITAANIDDVARFFRDADPTQDELLPRLEHLDFGPASAYPDIVLPLFRAIRRRQNPFRVCFHSLPHGFDEQLLVEYGDIVLIEDPTLISTQ
ncbi:hypothetical protein DL93DRAFT_2230304 [Clavulina sp. PMI_390]|nr:hypothetical protein DL93DRAFT_2230304 [Clavulina sp. PMI_390]